MYTADQTSNSVSVIDPSSNTVLGTIALGQPRVNGVLGPVDHDQVNVHGLDFSRDGRLLDAIAVTSNAAVLIDTATNQPLQTTYLERAPHEGFVSPDGRTLWVAERGADTVAVIDIRRNEVIDRIDTGHRPSKVVFSPDGDLAYVNHFDENILAVVRVSSRNVIARVAIPAQAGSSADEAVSPDGAELWLGHPGTGLTTVVDARRFMVKVSFETGPRTNHINFVTFRDAAYAYVTVGDLNVTKVFRRVSQYVGLPQQAAEVMHAVVGDAGTNCQPHGLWPSPDNTRVYVAPQKCDRVEVIDTANHRVVASMGVGQDPQALVYVAGATGSATLLQQGLGKRVHNFNVALRGGSSGASGQLQVREVLVVTEIPARVTELFLGHDDRANRVQRVEGRYAPG